MLYWFDGKRIAFRSFHVEQIDPERIVATGAVHAISSFSREHNGPVYRDFSRRNVRPTKYEPGVPLVVSCDWNLNFHAVICQYRQRKNELTHITNKFTADSVVLEEIGLPDSTTRDAAQEIVECLRRYSVAGRLHVTFVGDASGNQRNRVNADLNTDWKIFKAEISKAPFIHAEYPPCKRNPSVLESVGFVNAALRSDNAPPELTIDPSCRGLIKDFESVVFKRDHNGNFSTVISKDNAELTHFSDCARYFLANAGPRKAYFGEVGPRTPGFSQQPFDSFLR